MERQGTLGTLDDSAIRVGNTVSTHGRRHTPAASWRAFEQVSCALGWAGEPVNAGIVHAYQLAHIPHYS